MEEIESGSVDMVLADPPYGTTACKWDSVIPFPEMWEQLNRIIKPNGAIVLFGSEPFSSALRMSNIKSYKYDWIWDKKLAVGHLVAKKRPMARHEIISIFYKKAPTYNPQMVLREKPRTIKKKIGSGNTVHMNHTQDKDYEVTLDSRYPTTILLESNAKRGGLHPTQKPVALMEYLIKTYTNEGELVLDFTAGSFTTGVACQNTNRDFIGIEMDDNYFKIGSDRMAENKKRIEDTVVEKGLIDE
jgi:site-specific DNA-methyltransferase (adenine-specific)